MLKGVDLSHHNRYMKNMADVNRYDFVIMKATEGMSYKDNSVPLWDVALKEDTLRGYYHFARPDLNNSPEAEAKNFINVVSKFKELNPMLVIDVEGAALNVPRLDEWVLQWLKIVYAEFGYKPLIYTSEAYTRLFKKCAEWGCGLWCAKWSKNKPKKILPWPFWAIWQYTSNGFCSCVRVDENYFNGNREQFLKYCGVGIDEETENDRATDTTRD